jgi:hypothetical protein
MAVVSRATMTTRRKGSKSVLQKQSPLVILGGCLVLFLLVINLFSSSNEVDVTVDAPKPLQKDEHAAIRKTEPPPPPPQQQHTIERTKDDVGKVIVPQKNKEELKLRQNSVSLEHEDESNEGINLPRVEPLSEYHFEDHILFNHYYKGKSGVVIEDMLMAHAYTFHRNATYGGSCGDAGMKVARHQELLASIGLKEALPFLCPRDVQKAVKKTVLPRQTYRNDDTRIWTPEYVAYLKTLVHYPPKEVEDSNVFTIAVHVRRGDVTPCRDKNQGYDRYLPNLHYRNLIDQYYQPGARVVIFSQTTSHESFEEFSDKGYEVSLDDELDKIWRTIVTADVVILSRSSFSLIPAVVARGTVIYTPFWHYPIRDWVRVDHDTMAKTDAEIARLQEACL